MLGKKEESKERPVGEDMGSAMRSHDEYAREISIMKAAVVGKRAKACIEAGILDKIPVRYIPSPVSEFLYGAREDRKNYKGALRVKPTDIIEITATSVSVQGDRSKRKELKEARYSQDPIKQKNKLKKAA